jgi:hypothetical protein
MWIMNVVWPITGLYAGPLALRGYYTASRLSTKAAVQQARERNEEQPGTKKAALADGRARGDALRRRFDLL